MQIVYKKIEELKPYKNNPRKNDEAVPYVAESIKQFGFKVPIIIDNNNEIIAGHTRYKASIKLEMKEVPCIIADDLTEEQIKAFRLADNKVAEKAEWDMDLLELELQDIVDIDMEDFGFAMDISEDEKLEEDDYEVILPEVPRAKLREIYQLGNHRLMCGDSTNPADVQKLMNGATADLLHTDPPYNVNITNSEGMSIQNDNMEEKAFREFINKAMKNAADVLRPGGAFYVWHGDNESITFREALNKNQLSIRECLIWVKNNFNLGRQDYQWIHEPCLYGWKDGAAHYFINDRTQSTVFEDSINIDKMKKDELKTMLKQLLNNQNKEAVSVIHEDKPTKNDLHPTMKPIKLCGKLICNSTRAEENVLDLFGGSGSTLIACEQLNRKCYMMEYDPKYVDVIIDRWEQLTGQKAKKLR